jgi:hypothetical protein
MKKYTNKSINSETFEEKEIQTNIPEQLVSVIEEACNYLDKDKFSFVGPFIDFKAENKISFGVMLKNERDENNLIPKFRITIETSVDSPIKIPITSPGDRQEINP